MRRLSQLVSINSGIEGRTERHTGPHDGNAELDRLLVLRDDAVIFVTLANIARADLPRIRGIAHELEYDPAVTDQVTFSEYHEGWYTCPDLDELIHLDVSCF
jgi:hypothetical protein